MWRIDNNDWLKPVQTHEYMTHDCIEQVLVEKSKHVALLTIWLCVAILLFAPFNP